MRTVAALLVIWAAYRAGAARALGKSVVDSWLHPLTAPADLAAPGDLVKLPLSVVK